MTPFRPPPPSTVSVVHRRFPDRLCLWAGTVRVWRADLPVREAVPPDHLAAWATRAATGKTPAEVASALGLPEAVVAASLAEASAGRVARRPFPFLELPSGLRPVTLPPHVRLLGPEDVTAEQVPVGIVRGADIVPISADWRTVPVVWAERMWVVAVGAADGISVFAAGPDGEIDDSPTCSLPPESLPVADPDRWTEAWRDWCAANGRDGGEGVTVARGVARVQAADVPAGTWLWAGGGPLREGAIVERASENA